MVIRKASVPEKQIATTVGVATTETLMPIGTQTTATVAITLTGGTTTTISEKDFVGAMKMATTAAIDMGATLTATIPCQITSCHKSSISRLFGADDREDGAGK